MQNFTYIELTRIAYAVRNVWASCYAGGYLPGMSMKIGQTGVPAFDALQGNDKIEVVGSLLNSDLPMTAIISMGADGVEAAKRIQDGYAPYDMKPGFLKSKHAKIGKDGKKFFTVSFRHMTPDTSGKLGRRMSPSVHLAAMNKIDGDTIVRGSSFPEHKGSENNPSEFGLVNSANRINKRVKRMGGTQFMAGDYEWQNGPLAGMVNTVESKKGKRHSTYRTFRRISETTNPNAWWHPGVEGNDVIGAVVNYVAPIVKESIQKAAKEEIINQLYSIFNH